MAKVEQESILVIWSWSEKSSDRLFCFKLVKVVNFKLFFLIDDFNSYIDKENNHGDQSECWVEGIGETGWSDDLVIVDVKN